MSDAFPLVLPALFLFVPEGVILIEVGDAVLLVGDTDDLRVLVFGIFYRCNYI